MAGPPDACDASKSPIKVASFIIILSVSEAFLPAKRFQYISDEHRSHRWMKQQQIVQSEIPLSLLKVHIISFSSKKQDEWEIAQQSPHHLHDHNFLPINSWFMLCRTKISFFLYFLLFEQQQHTLAQCNRLLNENFPPGRTTTTTMCVKLRTLVADSMGIPLTFVRFSLSLSLSFAKAVRSWLPMAFSTFGRRHPTSCFLLCHYSYV